jgi:hypothetical protein
MVRNCTGITQSLAVPSHPKPFCTSLNGCANTKNSTSNALASNPTIPEVNAHSAGRLIPCCGGLISVNTPPR